VRRALLRLDPVNLRKLKALLNKSVEQGREAVAVVDENAVRKELVGFVNRQLERKKKPVFIRGLNLNHNHDLKNLFKSAATGASGSNGPFRRFYENLLLKGMKPELARLTLARKIAAITLHVWKKGEAFDAEYLKSQAA
jgi:hypothetical protein